MDSPTPLRTAPDQHAELVERVRASERALVGAAPGLERYLEHAEFVRQLASAIKRDAKPVKPAFAAHGLDYQLARQSMRMRETVDRHRREFPEIVNLGPSLVLVVNEAEQRFKRERKGADHLQRLVEDLLAGKPRSVVRAEHMPAKAGSPADRVIRLLRGGRMEPARQAFDACSNAERASLRVLAGALARLCGIAAVEATAGEEAPMEDGRPGLPAASIADAVGSVLR